MESVVTGGAEFSSGAPAAGPPPRAPERRAGGYRRRASQVRTSLRNSTKDAIAWSFMYGAGARHLMPFLVLGNQGLLQQAAFGGVPSLLGGVLQWFAADLTDRTRRRNLIIVASAVVQALSWLPLCVAVFLAKEQAFWLALFGYLIFAATGAFSVPPWASLMGDLVPPRRRGRYFGMRNALSGLVHFGSLFAAGWWLTWCQDNPRVAVLGLSGLNFGFLVVFVLSGIARFISAWYLAHVHEPPYAPQASDRFTMWEFLKRLPQAHFGRFVVYNALMNAGIVCFMNYLGWYLLKERGFSPGWLAVIMTMNLMATVLSQPYWGRLADRVGNKRVLALGGIGLVATPLLFPLSDTLTHYLLVMTYDGLLMGAFGLAAGNYFYDVVTPAKRARCGACNMLFVGTGVLCGCFIGALLATYAPLPLRLGGVTITHAFTLILLASAVLRLVPNLLLLWSFAEFRLRRPTFGPVLGKAG